MLSVNLPHSTPFSNWLLMCQSSNNNINTQSSAVPASKKRTGTQKRNQKAEFVGQSVGQAG